MIFLRLIRIPNLLIVVLTMLAMRYGIMYPMLALNGFELQLSTLNFSLLVVATVLITAAGYIINDYFDVKIDTINKPNDTLIGLQFKRQWAMLLHVVFNFVAIALAAYIGVQVANYKLCFVYVMAACMLWFYSTNFKKQLIVGNIIVAFLAGLVPLIIGLFEMPLLYKAYSVQLAEYQFNFNYIAYFMIAFGAFAFALSWIREIVKDMQDQLGDMEYGCQTMPIVWGNKVSAYVAIALTAITVAAIGYLQYLQYTSADKLSVYYLSLFVQFPLLLTGYKLLSATDKPHFAFVSKLIKIAMITGLLYAFVIHYELVHPALQSQELTEPAPSVSIGGGY